MVDLFVFQRDLHIVNYEGIHDAKGAYCSAQHHLLDLEEEGDVLKQDADQQRADQREWAHEYHVQQEHTLTLVDLVVWNDIKQEMNRAQQNITNLFE